MFSRQWWLSLRGMSQKESHSASTNAPTRQAEGGKRYLPSATNFRSAAIRGMRGFWLGLALLRRLCFTKVIMRCNSRMALSCSKETAMPTRRFERVALTQLLVIGCVVFGLIEHAQAQPGYVPPPTPLPPPVLNPSSPYTVPQPSYRPITPTTPSTTPSIPSIVPSDEATSPANEEAPSTTTRSERRTRSVHHYHRGRYTGTGPSLGSFDCSYGWCVRISPPLVSLLRRSALRPTWRSWRSWCARIE